MKNKLPVTIIVTVLNEEKSLDQLLVALHQQTYPAKQVIIADGGSSDKTVSKLNRFQAENKDFPLLYLTKAGNRSVGRNAAIEQASTDLIAVTDAGCMPHHDWLAELVDTYQSSQAPVIAGYYDAMARSDFEQAVIPYVLVMPDQVNAATFLPATRSMLLEKQVWKKLKGFNEKLADNEDFAFAQKIKNNDIQISFTDKAKVTWQPRSNLNSFAKMIWRFAKGDTFAGIWRPKVMLIFARYIFALLLLFGLIRIGDGKTAVIAAIAGVVIYSGWAIAKNIRYVPQGWYWLPILQFTADAVVILGSLQGSFNRYKYWLFESEKRKLT